MELDWMLRLVLFSIMHWLLAVIMLADLANRPRVLGGRKWPWALTILLITFVGSVLYLLCHPQVITGGGRHEGDRYRGNDDLESRIVERRQIGGPPQLDQSDAEAGGHEEHHGREHEHPPEGRHRIVG